MNAEEDYAAFKTKNNSLNQIRQLSEQELDGRFPESLLQWQ